MVLTEKKWTTRQPLLRLQAKGSAGEVGVSGSGVHASGRLRSLRLGAGRERHLKYA